MFKLFFGVSIFEFLLIVFFLILLCVIAFRLKCIIELLSTIERRVKYNKDKD